jgi:hypothetical protein
MKGKPGDDSAELLPTVVQSLAHRERGLSEQSVTPLPLCSWQSCLRASVCSPQRHCSHDSTVERSCSCPAKRCTPQREKNHSSDAKVQSNYIYILTQVRRMEIRFGIFADRGDLPLKEKKSISQEKLGKVLTSYNFSGILET